MESPFELAVIERNTLMMSLATLAIGLALFGLFYALVVACDHL
jgi:hypothetical protein